MSLAPLGGICIIRTDRPPDAQELVYEETIYADPVYYEMKRTRCSESIAVERVIRQTCSSFSALRTFRRRSSEGYVRYDVTFWQLLKKEDVNLFTKPKAPRPLKDIEVIEGRQSRNALFGPSDWTLDK